MKPAACGLLARASIFGLCAAYTRRLRSSPEFFAAACYSWYSANTFNGRHADVVELVDTQDLKS